MLISSNLWKMDVRRGVGNSTFEGSNDNYDVDDGGHRATASSSSSSSSSSTRSATNTRVLTNRQPTITSTSDDLDGKRKFSSIDERQSNFDRSSATAPSPSAMSTTKRPKINFGLISSSSLTSNRLQSPKPSTNTEDNKAMVSSSSSLKKSTPISIKLGSQSSKESTPLNLLKKASVFSSAADDDDDEEEEEMPPEARMRMRNVGRDTPTSTGPNSFGKTSKGFCDTRMIFEKQMKSKTFCNDGADGSATSSGDN